jgi:hypothetical protein
VELEYKYLERIARSTALLLVILFSSCRTVNPSPEQSFYTFEKIDSLILETGYPNNPWAATALQHQYIEGIDYIYTTDIDARKVLRINLINQQIDQELSLTFLEKDRYLVFNIHVLGADSILVLRDVTNFRSNSDSAFYLIDSIGNIITRFTGYPDEYVQSGMPKSPYSLTFKHEFLPLFGFNTSLFFRPSTYYGTITQRQRDSANLPEIIKFNELKDGKNDFIVSPIKIPRIKGGFYTMHQKCLWMLPLTRNELIMGYSNNSTLYKIKFDSGEIIDSTQNEALLVEKPIPLPVLDANKDGNNRQSTVFNSLVVDSINDQILRFANLGAKNDLTAGEFRDFLKNQWFGVYDTELNFLGQGMKPIWFTATWPKPINIKGYWYSVKTNPSDNFKLTVYKSKLVEIDSITKETFIENIARIVNTPSRKGLEHYPVLDNIRDKSIVLLVPENSCPACINVVTKYYVDNLDLMEDKGIYLLTNSSQAKNLLADRESNYVIQDERKNLENYLNSSISNPMLFYWSGKKVQKSIILNPDEARNLPLYIKKMEELINK